jgi:hypothetical protein
VTATPVVSATNLGYDTGVQQLTSISLSSDEASEGSVFSIKAFGQNLDDVGDATLTFSLYWGSVDSFPTEATYVAELEVSSPDSGNFEFNATVVMAEASGDTAGVILTGTGGSNPNVVPADLATGASTNLILASDWSETPDQEVTVYIVIYELV